METIPCTKSLRDESIVEPWVLTDHLGPLDLAPDHESIHRPLDWWRGALGLVA